MNGELVVHVGFHKTATTYLQKVVFPNLPGYQFIGRKFGDIDYGDGLYKKVMEALCCPSQDLRALYKCRELLNKRLEETNIIISDEWLTSNYDGFFGGRGAGWRDKLARLRVLLSGTNSRVLLIRRELLDNAFSLYCEFSQLSYGDEFVDFNSFCRHSPDADALVNGPDFIRENFGKKLVIMEYEEISPGFQSVLMFFGNSNISIAESAVNAKKSQGGAVVINKRSGLLIKIRRSLLVRSLSRVPAIRYLLRSLKPLVLFLFTKKRLIMRLTDSEKSVAAVCLESRRASS